MKKVDIVVPIYNAYEYTEECIKSILKNTNLNEHTLLLINDKSPDERILPMLQKYAKENSNKNIVVLENEENSGFVKTVNNGMKYSQNDVILLNSDTEVTENWLEKIMECAYSNEYIATVTPFTNNGTIFSIPNFGVDNNLPDNLSLDEFAKLVEKCSEKRYPEVTTGNGYCMYIKRSVLNEIGLFDDITFEKGYGEENDFCYRALDYGYINVLCDNTFIYHKGTQSFKKENMTQTRMELSKKHMELLRSKYPIYVQKTNNFIATNPFREIHDNINVNLAIYNKKRILFLINEWEENMQITGGTSLHLKDIINKVRKEFACFVLAPNQNDISVFDVYLYSGEYGRKIYSFKTQISDYGQNVYTDNSYREIVETLFETFKFNILHVQHFLFHSFDVINIAKKYNTYSIISLHDMYMLCPSINMVYEEKYCLINEKKDCVKCLNKRYGINNNIIQNWKETCKNVLEKFDKIIVPSENTKKTYLEQYSNLKIEVVEHGVNVIKVHSNSEETEKNNDIYDIAFVGVMAPHKGSKVLKEMVESKHSNVRIHLFGKVVDKNLEKNVDNYIMHGEYKREELPNLLKKNNIKLVCIFSTVPETYSYTLTETLMAEIPIISFDIGAVADRIQKDNLGWTITLNSSTEEIYSKIEEILSNKEEYEEKKNNCKNYKFKTIEEMQNEYEKMYEVNCNNEKSIDTFNTYKMIRLQKENNQYQYEIYQNMYGHIVYKYEKIRSTKIWRLAKKIKRMIRKR